jgi:hypothetical protein
MTRTRKDSSHFAKTVLEVVKRDDGTFDLFLNRKLDRSRVQQTWLPEELCIRFGFCGEEYDSILRDVDQNGKTTLEW